MYLNHESPKFLAGAGCAILPPIFRNKYVERTDSAGDIVLQSGLSTAALKKARDIQSNLSGERCENVFYDKLNKLISENTSAKQFVISGMEMKKDKFKTLDQEMPTIKQDLIDFRNKNKGSQFMYTRVYL